ncbi:DUF882 domain-containing protein [Acuticoccus mangrovi]|uniref:DUF882 domain-containing protein n=1 Tax=Acuticoccus mangrovi TaxID=2796142 RepID=UPI001E4CAE75|nr:DUF882 domain-containing protein [Acuticoccus mangrovi]
MAFRHGAGWSRVAAVVLAAAGALWGSALEARAENRTLDLYFTHTRESLKIVYKRNGQYVPGALRDLNRFLRDWRRNEATKMDPELFDLLWDVQQEFGGRTISVVSAYRSPATNRMLRQRSRGVAKQSQHMAGRAIDFYIKGVDLAKLRAAGMRRQVGGVGYYPTSGSPFVHFDTGSVRAWPRMSRSQLVKLFPDGKTLHLPSSGKPLSGYSDAQQLEKAGKLAKLDHGRGGTGVGVGSLFAFGGGGRSATSSGGTQVAAVNSGVIRPGQGTASPPPRTPSRSREEPEEKPAEVQTASLGASARATPEPAEERSGGFRQLPGVSLGGLIGRFRNSDEPEEASEEPEVRPVALPDAPLTAVSVEPAAEEATSAPAGPAPIPRIAPRGVLEAVPSETNEDAEAEGEGDEESLRAITVAALPPQRPASLLRTRSDANPTPLAYSHGEDVTDPSSPMSATTAMIPRTAMTPTPPGPSGASFASAPQAEVGGLLSPVRGASPALIANSSSIGEGDFSSLTARDHEGAAQGGVLMAQGFLGAPSGFQRGTTNWPSTKSFTGVRITVYARPRS